MTHTNSDESMGNDLDETEYQQLKALSLTRKLLSEDTDLENTPHFEFMTMINFPGVMDELSYLLQEKLAH